MTKIPSIRVFPILIIVFACFSLLSITTHGDETDSVSGINLDELQKTGYRLDWINQSNSQGLHIPTIIGDSLYIVDEEDFLTRYDLNSGKWLWSTPVGNQVFGIHGITEFKEENRVYVISDSAVYVLEKTTGNYPTQMSKKGTAYAGQKQILPLKFVASTPGLTTDQTNIVYGSNNGDLIWFNPIIGFDTNRYNIGSFVQVQPTYVEGIRNIDGLKRKTIVASSLEGDVIAIDLSQINLLWKLKLTSPVTSAVAYGTNQQIIDDELVNRTSVFIAGSDQYLRSVDLHTGKQRWKILTSSPLTDAPFYLQSVVYQHIPGQGLAAYRAFPNNLSGEPIWLANQVQGNVITTTNRGQLVCWDKGNQKLQIVDPRKGGVVSSMTIPTAKQVFVDAPSKGSLFVLTNGNTLLRLNQRR